MARRSEPIYDPFPMESVFFRQTKIRYSHMSCLFMAVDALAQGVLNPCYRRERPLTHSTVIYPMRPFGIMTARLAIKLESQVL